MIQLRIGQADSGAWLFDLTRMSGVANTFFRLETDDPREADWRIEEALLGVRESVVVVGVASVVGAYYRALVAEENAALAREYAAAVANGSASK